MNVYRPRGASRELFGCREPEVLIEGPAGTGKTRGALTKARLVLEKYPGARALFYRKTRESLTETVLVEWENVVLGPEHPACQGASRRVRQVYDFPNGSSAVVAGLDKPAKIMSGQFDLAFGFEGTELTENDHEFVQTRLRNGVVPYQQSVTDCNPAAPTHWLNQRALKGRMRRLISRHQDNPRWWDAARNDWTEEGRRYVLGVLANLTGVRRLRLFDGVWAAAEGLVYDAWDPAVHVVDRMPDGWEAWRKIRSIDFGYNNPLVCQWWAIDPDGRMYLYRELYMSGRTVKVHAEQIHALSAGERYEATIADHDLEDRATLAENGIPTVAAIKAIERGIQLVANRLAKGGDGRPRLFFLAGALVERDRTLSEQRKLPCCTTEEMDGYVWARSPSGLVIKEQPVKENDHGMDALRYAVAHVDAGLRLSVGVAAPSSDDASIANRLYLRGGVTGVDDLDGREWSTW